MIDVDAINSKVIIPRSAVDAIGLLSELPGGIKPCLEIGVCGGRALVFFVLRESPRLVSLQGGHRSVKLLVASQKFGL